MSPLFAPAKGSIRVDESPADQPSASSLSDPDAFRQQALQHRAGLYRVAARMVDHQSAEDLVQEALTRAFASRQSFRGDSRAFSWFCGILINLCRSELSRRRRRRWFSLNWLIEGPSDAPSSPNLPDPDAEQPSETLQRKERRQLLHKALAELPEAQRAALVLVSFEGLSARDAASALNSSEEAIWKAVSRGRARLKEVLHGQV